MADSESVLRINALSGSTTAGEEEQRDEGHDDPGQRLGESTGDSGRGVTGLREAADKNRAGASTARISSNWTRARLE